MGCFLRIGAVGLLVGAFALAGFIWWNERGVYSSSEFSVNGWFFASQNPEKCSRGMMAFALIEVLESQRPSFSGVEEMLGIPDMKFDSEYWYELGFCRSYGIGDDYLHIYFDSGNFIRAEIVHH